MDLEVQFSMYLLITKCLTEGHAYTCVVCRVFLHRSLMTSSSVLVVGRQKEVLVVTMSIMRSSPLFYFTKVF